MKKEIPFLSTMIETIKMHGDMSILVINIFYFNAGRHVFFITNYVVKFFGIIQLFVQAVK